MARRYGGRDRNRLRPERGQDRAAGDHRPRGHPGGCGILIVSRMKTDARPIESIDYEMMSLAQEPTTAKKPNDGPPTGPAGASKIAADASLRNLLPLAWPLFVVMWLVFPVASVVDMLGTNLTPVRLLAFLALMVAYVAVYLWF